MRKLFQRKLRRSNVSKAMQRPDDKASSRVTPIMKNKDVLEFQMKDICAWTILSQVANSCIIYSVKKCLLDPKLAHHINAG